MQRYGLQPTGHHQQNIAALQEKYDEEFQKSQAGRNEYLEKRRKLDAARRKRAMYEAQHVEEMEALARNPKLEVWYNLVSSFAGLLLNLLLTALFNLLRRKTIKHHRMHAYVT
jgi:hypothetical protein